MIAVRNFAVVAFTLVLCWAVPEVLAQESTAPTVSSCQARRTIVGELQKVMTGGRHLPRHIPSQIRVDAEQIEFYGWVCCGSGKDYIEQRQLITLKDLTPFSLMFVSDDAAFRSDTSPGWSLISNDHPPSPALWALTGTLQWSSEADAQAFVGALNRLIAYARTYDPANTGSTLPCEQARQAAFWNDFHEKATAWRALSTKPPISDEVRQHRLLAEDAFKEKQFGTAIDEYEAGLVADPVWPQGHFNAALLYGEQKDYEDAIWHMRAYLELVPDASDAQAARDQLLLWQGKLKQQEVAGPK